MKEASQIPILLILVILLYLTTGCVVMPPDSTGDGSVTVQVVLYQRGGTIAAPTGANETLSETATNGGGSPSLKLTGETLP